MKTVFIITSFFYCFLPLTLSSQTYHNGDVVFIKNKFSKGKSVLPNGKSKFNYVGILFIENKIPVVYHATEPLSKCTFSEFLDLSEEKEFKIKYLSEDELLNSEAIEKMHNYALTKLGSSYDNALSLDNDKLYNAEFVWNIYQNAIGLALCIPRPIKDFKDDNPVTIDFLTEAYGPGILEQKIISVGDLFQSQFLD